jgi:hypothetical protein
MNLFTRRRRTQALLGYSAMSIQSDEDEDEDDTICLLLPVVKPPRRREKLRVAWSTIWKACRRVCRRRRRHKANNTNIGHSYSATTSPTSMRAPREYEASLASVPSPPFGRQEPRPMYYIISEVGSVAMRAEQTEEGLADRSLDEWSDEEVQGRERRSRACTGLRRLSLSNCFHRPAADNNNHYYNDEKDIETIPMSIEDEDEVSFIFSDDAILSLMSEDEPPPIVRTYSRFDFGGDFGVNPMTSMKQNVPREVKVAPFPSQCRREETAESLSLHSSIGDDEYWSDEEGGDSRDDSKANGKMSTTRECVQLLFPRPILPFQKVDPIEGAPPLLAAFPHPSASTEVHEYQTLGIHSAHPHWMERKKNTIWDQTDVEPLTLDDDDLLLPLSHIQVEPWSNNMWMEEPSLSAHSIEDEEPWSSPDWGSDDETSLPTMDWTRKIYQPIFRLAQEITTCGQLADTVFEEAPFDEVQNDMVHAPYDEVAITIPTRRKSTLRALKPNPKDSPSFATWMREVGLPRSPLWDDFLQKDD